MRVNNIKASFLSLDAQIISGEEEFVHHMMKSKLSSEEFKSLNGKIKYIGVTDEFKKVMKTFKVPEGETPAGFKKELLIEKEGVLRVNLARDISYDKNGKLRATKVLFSADSANPYEVEPIAPLIANLTCNPGIIYDLFINNPKANINGLYKNRDEVMGELARILGPGCDISVELNNPFETDFNKILDEAARFKEMLSEYRVVIKVPHTGAVTKDNYRQLLEGDQKLNARQDKVDTAGALHGHNLALKLQEHGYRVNFTLMFEPFQTQLALQAKPYFINSFIRHRLIQSEEIKKLIDSYEITHDKRHLESLRNYFIACDYYAPEDKLMDVESVYTLGKGIIKYRHFEDAEGQDGLDSMRHNLRLLKNCNLADTRLIVCSMEGPFNYPDIDKLMCEPEFIELHHKLVITAEPNYLARFTSTNQVISYQRRFMNAAKGQK
jgi:Transaldolase.